MSDFKILIPSARFSNLDGCVRSILDHDPLPKDRILVIDDGARKDAPPNFPVTWVDGAKPFVFSRNINLGWMAAGFDSNVILLNDDARLKTVGGFSYMAQATLRRPSMGVCSAAIDGMVGNPNQHPKAGVGLRTDPRALAFICVYIPARTSRRIGFLDERYVAYGGDDMDYCRRTLDAGLELGIFDGCVVSHGEVPSTFRTKPDIDQLLEEGRRLYTEKFGKLW